jgi:hypothetical protein
VSIVTSTTPRIDDAGAGAGGDPAHPLSAAAKRIRKRARTKRFTRVKGTIVATNCSLQGGTTAWHVETTTPKISWMTTWMMVEEWTAAPTPT